MLNDCSAADDIAQAHAAADHQLLRAESAGLHSQRAMVQNLKLPVMAVGAFGQCTTQAQAHALVNRQPLAFQIA